MSSPEFPEPVVTSEQAVALRDRITSIKVELQDPNRPHNLLAVTRHVLHLAAREDGLHVRVEPPAPTTNGLELLETVLGLDDQFTCIWGKPVMIGDYELGSLRDFAVVTRQPESRDPDLEFTIPDTSIQLTDGVTKFELTNGQCFQITKTESGIEVTHLINNMPRRISRLSEEGLRQLTHDAIGQLKEHWVADLLAAFGVVGAISAVVHARRKQHQAE